MRSIMKNLYDLLRWAENCEGAKSILLFDISEYYSAMKMKPEFLETVIDKIFRSTSGKKLYIYAHQTGQLSFSLSQLAD